MRLKPGGGQGCAKLVGTKETSFLDQTVPGGGSTTGLHSVTVVVPWKFSISHTLVTSRSKDCFTGRLESMCQGNPTTIKSGLL